MLCKIFGERMDYLDNKIVRKKKSQVYSRHTRMTNINSISEHAISLILLQLCWTLTPRPFTSNTLRE